jgi:hypothetical protein
VADALRAEVVHGSSPVWSSHSSMRTGTANCNVF